MTFAFSSLLWSHTSFHRLRNLTDGCDEKLLTLISFVSAARLDTRASFASTWTLATVSPVLDVRMVGPAASGQECRAGLRPSPATVLWATVHLSVRSGYRLPVILHPVWMEPRVDWRHWTRTSVTVRLVILVSATKTIFTVKSIIILSLYKYEIKSKHVYIIQHCCNKRFISKVKFCNYFIN